MNVIKDTWYRIAHAEREIVGGELTVSWDGDDSGRVIFIAELTQAYAKMKAVSAIVTDSGIKSIRIANGINGNGIDVCFGTNLQVEINIVSNTQSTWTIVPAYDVYGFDAYCTFGVKDIVESNSGGGFHFGVGKDWVVKNFWGKDELGIIKQDDFSGISDKDVFSSLRARQEFLNKREDDTAEGKVTFEKGLNAGGESTFENLNVLFKALVNQLEANTAKTGNLTNEEKITTFDLLCRNLAEIYKLNVTDTATIVACILKSSLSSTTFRSGLLGEGMRLSKEGERWILELDEIVIRKTMTVFELIVQRIKHQGGWVLHSPCGGKITKVENVSGGWKCYHDATEDFEAGDLILCQNFKVGSVAQNPDGAQSIDGASVKRYWRKADAAGKGYVILSKSICEPGSSIPAAGDEFAVMGNLTNTARQNAILVASSGQNTPFVAYYTGINGFSLSGKEVMREGNLSGIFDADFGNLSGFGLYANNVFLKGVFRLTSGKTIEEYADNAAKKTIDNLKLGIRNLAAGYKTPKIQDGGYYSINTVGPLKGGMDYVVSFDAEILIDKGYLSALPHNAQSSIPIGNTVKTQGNKRYAIIIKPQTDVHRVVIAPQNGYAVAGSNNAGKAIFSNVAIYEGTKDVGFIEAPEDVMSSVEAKINVRADAIESRVNAVDGRITSVVQTIQGLTATVSGLDGRLSTVEQTQTSWSSTIQKSNKVISQILQDGENVKIAASQINLIGDITANGNVHINVDGTIVAKNGIFQGRIEAESGRIAGFNIVGNVLSNQNPDGSFINGAGVTFKDEEERMWATVGAGVVPGGAIGSPVAYFQNFRWNYNTNNRNTALILAAAGADPWNNHALNIMCGFISGFAIKPVIVISDSYLSSEDGIVICANQSNTITVHLPAIAEQGKVIIIRRRLGGEVVIRSQGAHRIDWGQGLYTQAGIREGAGRAHLYYFVADVWYLQHLGN